MGCPAGEWAPGVGTLEVAEVEQWAEEGLHTEVTCTAAVDKADPTTEDTSSRLVCIFCNEVHYRSIVWGR